VVTLGNFSAGVGSVQEQAGTLMHELGHNLGLRHGGCNDDNLRSSYGSVMNYAYQMDGLTRGGLRGVVDFSRGQEPILDRALLSPLPALLRNPAAEAWARANACTGRAEAGAGTSVQALVPVAADSEADENGCSADTDDWAAVRLRVGSIGEGVSAVPGDR
jgi:hypothetical protein